MRFSDLNLIDPLLRAVAAEGYVAPTPIQAQAISHILAGRDLLGLAQTGTGKTAAFALPILQRLDASRRKGRRVMRVLVVAPTRELASQIGDSFATYGKNLGFHHTVIFGGVGQRPQEQALDRGVDIVVATPGRLLDLMNNGFVDTTALEIFVLDEADRMLDMGFLPDVKRIIAKLPQRRQTLFFSATMPPEAAKLAAVLLRDPVRVAVTPPATTVEKVRQSVIFAEKAEKQPLLEHLLRDPAITRVLVFTRTKHGANKVTTKLQRAGISAEAIHGNKSQGARERALAGFKSGAVRVLVATDIAARGIDVDEISHVINFDLPNVPESYVHRIGRTARAGASGDAISFCDREERAYLKDIEREIRMCVPVVELPSGFFATLARDASEQQRERPLVPSPVERPQRPGSNARRRRRRRTEAAPRAASPGAPRAVGSSAAAKQEAAARGHRTQGAPRAAGSAAAKPDGAGRGRRPAPRRRRTR